MQLAALLQFCGVVLGIVVVTGLGYFGWYIWTWLVTKTLRDIYNVVTNHLEQGLSLARPQDKPGSDPGTKQLVFRRQSPDTVIIARIDWDGSLEKHYAITAMNHGVRCNYSLVRTGTRQQPTAADTWWAKRPMTPRRARRLRDAVGDHYVLAYARQRDDTPVESISF